METVARSRMIPRTAWLGGALLALPIIAALPAYGQTVTRYTYDAGDHITSITDPRGLVTTYTYDGLGQKWQQVSPDSGTTTYSYDAYGRLASMTRPGGNQVSYAYDTIGRRTSATAGGLTQTFTYDNCTNGAGRLCAVSDANSRTTYVYSPEGWITGRGFAVGGTSYSLGYSYDALGHVTTVAYPDGNQALYTYTNGVVSMVQAKINGVVSTVASGIGYQPADVAMAQWIAGSGLATTLSYDTDGRLTSLNASGVQNLGFRYDVANRIVGITNGIDGSMPQSFGYDAMSRLTSVQSGADYESFSYDADGNRTAQVLNGTSVNVTTNGGNNQLIQLAGANNTSYSYDARGNLTTVNGATTFTYDPFNRMSAAGTSTYVVGPEGQRLRKIANGATTLFASDAAGPLLAESQSTGWIDYVWLNGRLIARVNAGQVQAIHADQTGRPEAMTDANRNVIWRARNFAFDRTVVQDNAVPLNLGFPGQYYDAESGLWNNGFRDYCSTCGRYIESDPLGLTAGVNTYVYALSNPVQRTDPHGLDSGYMLSGDIGSLMSGGRKAGGPFVFGALAGETGLGPVHLETESVAIGGYDGQNGAYGAMLSASGAATGYGPYSAAVLYGLETMSDGTTVPLTLYEVNIGEGIPGLGKIGLGAGAFKECGKWGFYVHATGGIGNGSGSLGFGVSP